MYLEALALVKVEEYCVNMFIKIIYIAKNKQNIAYNYIYSKKKKKKKLLDVFVLK